MSESAANPRDPNRSLALEVRDLHVILDGRPILKGVNLELPRGQIVALIGPNGSGKTTLLRTVLGLQKHDRGQISILGETNLSSVIRKVGYVPQRLSLDRSFPLTVREFLATRHPKTRNWIWTSPRRLDPLVIEAVPHLDVGPLLDRKIAELSGGELQRVLIAFSLLGSPELLLLDEPTAGVDTPGEHTFYELIGEIQQARRLTVVLVSHDLSMVYKHASWIYALNGVVCCEGPPEQIMNAESLRQAYGVHVTAYHHHHGPHAHCHTHHTHVQ